MQDQITAEMDNIIEYNEAEAENRYNLVDDYIDIPLFNEKSNDFDPYIQFGRDN